MGKYGRLDDVKPEKALQKSSSACGVVRSVISAEKATIRELGAR